MAWPSFPCIFQSGFITVMSVGYKYRFIFHKTHYGLNGFFIGYRPDAMDLVGFIIDFNVRFVSLTASNRAFYTIFRIGIIKIELKLD